MNMTDAIIIKIRFEPSNEGLTVISQLKYIYKIIVVNLIKSLLKIHIDNINL